MKDNSYCRGCLYNTETYGNVCKNRESCVGCALYIKDSEGVSCKCITSMISTKSECPYRKEVNNAN